MLTLVQDSLRSTELEKQATSKDVGTETTVRLRISPLDRMIPLHRKSSRPAQMSGLKTTEQGMIVSLQLNLRWDRRLTLSFLELC